MSKNLFASVANEGGLVDRVVAEIQQLIVTGRLKPGAKLPPENTLAEQLGVSRTVIREAVRMLSAKGLVESKQGVGTLVRELSRAQVLEPLSLLFKSGNGKISLEHLYQVRALLEIEMVGLAAANRTVEDLNSLHSLIETLDASQADPDLFAAQEANFHTKLACATQNPLLEVLVGVIRDLLEEYIRTVMAQIPHVRPLYVARHRKIVAHVEACDVEAAKAEMAQHLTRVRLTMNQLFQNGVADVHVSAND